jgi:hypothetical protein
MGLVTVTVRLQDTTVDHDPVVGATIRFYTDADVFVTEEDTDVDGKVDVLLDGAVSPGGTVYHVRAYKPGCGFDAPWQITVFDPPLPAPDNNDFLMDVNIFELPASPYPGICRVSGYLYGQDGKAIPDGVVRLVPYDGVPRVYYAGLVAGVIESKSDSLGRVLFDAMCGGTYEIVVADWPELRRRIRIPERSAVLFGDLIFPIPATVEFDPVGPYSLAVLETLALDIHVTGSDYNDWFDGGEYIEYLSSDPAVLLVSRAGTQLILQGKSDGTANIEVTRTSKAFRVVPDRVSSWSFPVVVHA